MKINPADISVETNSVYGSWGIHVGYDVTLTHKPTNTTVTSSSKLIYQAKNKAFAELQKLLDSTPEQLELF